MEKKKVLDALEENFPDKTQDISTYGDDAILINKDILLDIVKFLKEGPYAFTMLLDLTCVDYPGQEERFQMIYHLFSLSNNQRLKIKTSLPEKEPVIDSLTSFWKNADWLEREVFDMFGVQFTGHPDLRRIFMWDEFEGYPLRKDYPLRKHQPRIPLKE